jgi:hypothetical protein
MVSARAKLACVKSASRNSFIATPDQLLFLVTSSLTV